MPSSEADGHYCLICGHPVPCPDHIFYGEESPTIENDMDWLAIEEMVRRINDPYLTILCNRAFVESMRAVPGVMWAQEWGVQHD